MSWPSHAEQGVSQGARADARKRHEAAAVESLEVVIARHLHTTWCDAPGHSYGEFDYEDARPLAELIRAHVASGGVL